MTYRRQTVSGPNLPPLDPWLRNLLGGLFALYVAELFAKNLGFPLDAAIWHSFGTGFAPWQLITRFFVQGMGVMGVLVGLLVMYFFLPALTAAMSRARLIRALGSGAVGGTVLALVLDICGWAPGHAYGWSSFVTGMVVLFGLANPGHTVHLYFVLPIRGIWFVYGTVIVTLMLYLAHQSLGTAENIGTWMGIVAWWSWRGPGARKRRLREQARSVERELGRFTVLDGGRTNNRPEDDDVFH